MKLDILFHYDVDENTGKMTFIGKEEITVDTAASVKKQSIKTTKVVECNDPLIKLDSNKLILTTGAVSLLGVEADCRIDIKYKKKDKISVPVIGTDVAFGTKGGKINISYIIIKNIKNLFVIFEKYSCNSYR